MAGKSIGVGLAVSLLITAALSSAIVMFACGRLFTRELALGVAFAFANGAAAVALHRRALRSGMAGFLRWALLGDAVRLAAAGGLLGWYRWCRPEAFVALAIPVVVGYLVFMMLDVWVLHAERPAGGR
jgi:hypothetical protein